jgi:hypothetical protein
MALPLFSVAALKREAEFPRPLAASSSVAPSGAYRELADVALGLDSERESVNAFMHFPRLLLEDVEPRVDFLDLLENAEELVMYLLISGRHCDLPPSARSPQDRV